MCGIAGIIDFHEPIDGLAVKKMLSIINHRGPDDHSCSFEPFFAGGMTRLSIIDIDGGKQPIYNETGSIFTYFNGEIYNYLELKQDLQQKGHWFKTESDTEVIVHLYEEYGIDFINKLNGMFSFVLVDKLKDEIYLIRDHFGIKPLYYSITATGIIFGSELKSLLASGYVEKTISNEGIVNYFSYHYIPSPKTIYKNIHKLPAGTFLNANAYGHKVQKWYSLESLTPLVESSYYELKTRVRDLIEDSIRLQLRSDVPVGAFLSGGIDSSLITAIAAKQSLKPLKTFSVGFSPTEFDELPYARLVSKLYETDHLELIVTGEDAVRELPNLMWYMDEPIGDSAVLPNYLICQLAARHVKVALSGLGGDELFGGYSRYAPHSTKFDTINKLPIYLKWPFISLGANLSDRFKDLFEKSRLSEAERYFLSVKQINNDFLKGILNFEYSDSYTSKDLIDTYNSWITNDSLNKRMATDISLYMNDQLLHLTDRMSMASSLEARVPLLDHRLVELSLGIPSRYKINKEKTKIILKDAINDLLPSELIHRKKWGFAAPHKKWLMTKAMGELIEMTMNGKLVSDGILRRKGVQNFLGNTELINRYSTWVWPIVALEMWYANYRKL